MNVGWSENLRAARLFTVSELWKGIRKDEQNWKQKSRVKWLKNGDRNSKFFHILANDRKRKNFILDISIDGVVCSEPQDLRRGIVDFFKCHFEQVSWSRPSIENIDLKKLGEWESASLEVAFSLEEVWEAVRNCDGDKAPGPDCLNFNFNFIKANWEAIKEDIMDFFFKFHNDGSLVKELNYTFITLIPKVSKSTSMGDFRPINLVGSMYKVVAKVLNNLIKKVMTSIVGENQMAFIKDRQILDSFVTAEEIIHKWRKGGDGGLLVKLDFEKAYDSVDHFFLEEMLVKMGFGLKWRNWIKGCIFTPKMSILINGSPTILFEGIVVQKDVEDTVAWKFSSSGLFFVSSFRNKLEDFTERCVDPKKRKNQATEAWVLPRGNVLKLNVDGSSLGNPGSAVNAIHKAVELCCSAQLCCGQEIVFESDSKVVVSWINGNGIGNFSLVHFIYDIRSNLNLLEGELLVVWAGPACYFQFKKSRVISDRNFCSEVLDSYPSLVRSSSFHVIFTIKFVSCGPPPATTITDNYSINCKLRRQQEDFDGNQKISTNSTAPTSKREQLDDSRNTQVVRSNRLSGEDNELVVVVLMVKLKKLLKTPESDWYKGTITRHNHIETLKHLEAYLKIVRKRQHMFPEVYQQNVNIIDPYLYSYMVNWWDKLMPARTRDKPFLEWPVLSYKWTDEQLAWASGNNEDGCRPWKEVNTV
ncbi:hypothetical protein Ddye_008079 [Dipteronia dyeriana]|uniref:Reverse transcriptase domain-containing protein n=1 Tax=Dipteronia dyeriana TaxID=168575 RepID=A0AAD9X950_9ROSI|nr:hypothetical protein Ddye_008079 [Dipteronia dyeriana]